MALRKACAYSKKKVTPYTRRSNVKSKSYIKTIPQQKIVKFKMGDIRGYEKGKLRRIVKLVSGEKVVIRDNALEAARQYIQNTLQKTIPGLYYFEVKVFPHHILRENKVYGGGSKGERINTGMQQSFGTTLGRAAIVKKNQDMFLLAVFNDKARKDAAVALTKIKAKLPCKSKLIFEKKE